MSNTPQDLDFMSDSDWLDISSGQDSDDSDSILGSDIDDSIPLSRTSSISADSSDDGQVEAWEGLVTDDDEVQPIDATPATESLSSTVTNVNEEFRVRAALDQSMMSTLSASRSSSAGHNSFRDLRLSFPDPLTSSGNELDRSYDQVSPVASSFDSEEKGYASDSVVDYSSQDPCDQIQVPQEETAKTIQNQLDIDQPSDYGPVESLTEDAQPTGSTTCQLDIVLYGSWASRQSFVEALLSQAAVGGDGSLSVASRMLEPTYRTHYCLHAQGRDIHIAVHDVVDMSNVNDLTTQARPSLAIVFFPSLLPKLGYHTAYLPVFTHDGELWESQRIWKSYSIPPSKIFRLKYDTSSLVDTADLANLHSPFAWQALDKLVPSLETKMHIRYTKAQGTAIIGFAMFFMYAVALAGPALSQLARQSIPRPTYTQPLWGLFGPVANHTAAISSTAAKPCNAVVPSSIKDFALAVFNPVSPSPFSHASTPAVREVDATAPRKLLTTDVILRPVSPTPSLFEAPPKPIIFVIETTASSTVEYIPPSKPSASTSLSIINANVVALSNTVDETMKAVSIVAQHDLKELLEALDDLSIAIGQQTSAIVDTSRGTARHIRERLRYRNERAKGRARQLRVRGGQMIASAGENLKDRAERAKVRAREFRQSLQVLATTIVAEGRSTSTSEDSV